MVRTYMTPHKKRESQLGVTEYFMKEPRIARHRLSSSTMEEENQFFLIIDQFLHNSICKFIQQTGKKETKLRKNSQINYLEVYNHLKKPLNRYPNLWPKTELIFTNSILFQFNSCTLLQIILIQVTSKYKRVIQMPKILYLKPKIQNLAHNKPLQLRLLMIY